MRRGASGMDWLAIVMNWVQSSSGLCDGQKALEKCNANKNMEK